MVEKACRSCHLIISEGSQCPICGSKEITDKWASYMVIFDPENSELAKKIGAKIPGKYAISIKG
ncbi:MAG: transcription elongation factor Spt4 [Candidatus Micrarchaeota archaeon]|nr:transcription elongation factor Spt4 [Candidatus Micrarchaeota archaeon]